MLPSYTELVVATMTGESQLEDITVNQRVDAQASSRRYLIRTSRESAQMHGNNYSFKVLWAIGIFLLIASMAMPVNLHNSWVGNVRGTVLKSFIDGDDDDYINRIRPAIVDGATDRDTCMFKMIQDMLVPDARHGGSPPDVKRKD
eukprot:GHVS01083088.1.p1 GENE.GHVS01083088.1~~GHVS01083088.1.p1  ORF type:complete len:145 (+),score=11.34 GHVS01083088.1:356-790(+)